MAHEALAATDFDGRLSDRVIADRAAAECYVAKVCFKTGPPRQVGLELEWTVHHRDDPSRPLDPAALAAVLGDYSPTTLRSGSTPLPLPEGGLVTVEPGGQVEISTRPRDSLAELLATTSADIDRLTSLLDAGDLTLGDAAVDAYRPARRILDTPRYAAMEHAFDRRGTDGRIMMCNAASVQVCLDVGAPHRIGHRWAALHAIGPVFLATFANSPDRPSPAIGANSAGPAGPSWASARMRSWFGIDPSLADGATIDTDPAPAWAAHALDSPLICVRSGSGDWAAPPDVTFADWIAGALARPPTYDDLDYHLSTLFPLVRPRGYFEVRYLDAQPGDDWLAPAALIAALFAREDTVDAALGLVDGAAGRWLEAARDGLTDPVLARTAPALLDLACSALHDTDLAPSTIAAVEETARRRLARGDLR